jgi:excisionase family DNA binding protein
MGAVHIPTEEDIRRILREELAALVAELRAAPGRPPDELDTAAAAALAGVSPETVRDWIRRRGLPAHRPPGARDFRIARADLLAFQAAPLMRRPPVDRGPVDLAVEADKILLRSRRG